MKKLYSKYGSILFVDSTYKLNRNKYPCMIIAIQDQDRVSYIVAAALLAYERMELTDAIIKFFIKENAKYINQTRLIMIDKDLKEDKILKDNFPNAQLLFCFWHVQKIFKKNIKDPNLLDLLDKMMNSNSEDEWNEHYGNYSFFLLSDYLSNRFKIRFIYVRRK